MSRIDDFQGENSHLVECINALLDMDDAKALVPHGLGKGSHAYRMLTAASHRLSSATAKVERLEEALLQHNERLRSAASIADRDGEHTNWKAFRGQVHYTLAEYHDLVNECRADLKGEEG